MDPMTPLEFVSPPPTSTGSSVYSLAPGDRHPWVGSMYIDYCRAFAIAATGGTVIIPSGKDERCSAAMMLGSDDGIGAIMLGARYERCC